jgi:hypothetical protein
MGLPCRGLGCVDDNVELCSSSGDPVGQYACEIVSASEISAVLFREPVFLGAGPATSALIRARSVVQVHPGPPINSRLSSDAGIIRRRLVHVLVHTPVNKCVRSPAFCFHADVRVVLDHPAANVA